MTGARTYQLYIRLQRRATIAVGRLGRFTFPAGLYVYTGSARRNLEARVARHLVGAPRLHWHIDYLLAHPAASVIEVRRSSQEECLCNQATAGAVVVPGFGSSDCRSGCGSHLKRVSLWPEAGYNEPTGRPT